MLDAQLTRSKVPPSYEVISMLPMVISFSGGLIESILAAERDQAFTTESEGDRYNCGLAGKDKRRSLMPLLASDHSPRTAFRVRRMIAWA